jgi:hypothetical protein
MKQRAQGKQSSQPNELFLKLTNKRRYSVSIPSITFRPSPEAHDLLEQAYGHCENMTRILNGCILHSLKAAGFKPRTNEIDESETVAAA